MIYVIATVEALPDRREAFLAGARAVIAETVKEEGCLSYDLNESITTANTFVFVERWSDRAKLAAHFDTAHLKVWRRVGDTTVKRREVEIIHATEVEKL